MKTIKDDKVSLLLKSALLENRNYLCVTALHYFDFNNPEEPLKEADMWKDCMKELNGATLDLAMPKPNAEVLVCGSCHNPLDDESASHVKLQVGTIEKELFVFGDRFWNLGQISRDNSFKKMPLTYSNSFGGKGFAKNPTGKGYGSSTQLPNIEEPKKLISNKKEKRDPAGFMPYDISWEQCASKLGTYDEKWKNELWPGFAADMDYTHFNVAPQDQQQSEYFKGGENISIVNMHPEHHILSSSIPELSIRCFTTTLNNKDEELFAEVEMRRDTLWLFPEIQRGVLIFRGEKEVKDEEYSDVKYLNLKTLRDGEKPKSLDDVYTLQKKELSRVVEVEEKDTQGDDMIKKAQGELFDIPRSFKESDLEFNGKRPSMIETDEERLQKIHAHLDESIAQLDASHSSATEFNSELSHKSSLDTTEYEKERASLVESKKEYAELFKDAKEMKAQALKKAKEIKSDTRIPQKDRDAISLDGLEPKVKVWNDYAFEFLCNSVKKLEKEPEMLHKLRSIGLEKRTIKRSWLGYNSEALSFESKDWKLKDEKPIEIPKGLIIPRFKESKLISLRVIDETKLLDSKAILVKGSDKDFENILCYESENFPLFYFTSDTQAHLCDQECYDICNSITSDELSTCSSDESKKLLESASVIFYLEKDGFVEKLPNAIKFDTKEYKDLFAMHKDGVEIRPEILENLPKDEAQKFPKHRDFSASGINKKTAKITDAMRAKLEAEGKALKAELMAEKDKAIAKSNASLKAQGLPPIDLSKLPANPVDDDEFISESEVSKHFDNAISKLKKQNSEHGLNITDKISELEKAKTTTLASVKKASAAVAAAKIKFAQIEKDAQIAKEKAVENPKFTRELVIEYYEQKKSLVNENLSFIDLSKLDLKGIDLSGANLMGVDFEKSNLSEANLQNTDASKANFSETILNDATVQNAIFTQALFKKSVASSLNAKNTLFNKALFDGAKLQNSNFANSDFQESIVTNSNFSASEFKNVSFSQCTIAKSVFDDVKIDRGYFNETSINGSQFQHISSMGLTFSNCEVVDSNFSKSRLFNMRLMSKSIFDGCSFSSSNIETSTIHSVTLKQCNLQKCSAEKTYITKTEVMECDFRALQAQKSRFEFNNISYTNMSGMNFLKGSFRKTFLQNCNLSYANLFLVEFFKVQLHKCSFDNANLKRSSLENRLEFIDDKR